MRDAFADITISTIDAFCLSLLHEFPLEAGVDPGFDLADETETPRLVNGALDRALRIGRALARPTPTSRCCSRSSASIAPREGLAALLDRRLVAFDALNRFLRGSTLHVDRRLPAPARHACGARCATCRAAPARSC